MRDETVIKNKLIWWFLKLRSLDKVDIILEFFVYWICFDSYITYYSQEYSDYKKLQWFFTNDTPLRASYDENFETWHEAIDILASYSVADMRPKHEPAPIRISYNSTLEEIITVIYRVRCNLFHGSKDLNDPKDMDLIKGALLFMKGWIDSHMYQVSL